MKNFIKFTIASTLGVVLAGIILTIIGFVTVAGMITSTGTETTVKENSVLMLDLDGILYERVENNPLENLMSENFQSYGLNDIIASIQKAKDDENIKGRPPWSKYPWWRRPHPPPPNHQYQAPLHSPGSAAP